MKRIFDFSLVLSLILLLHFTALAQRPERQQPYARTFALQGIEFNEEQQAKVEELRKQYAPQLDELQQQRNAVYTQEQRQAQREAMQAARDAGKSLAEARAEIDKAVNLTDEQKQKLADIQKSQDELLEKIRGELTGLLTDEQKRQQARAGRQRREAPARNVVKPTHPDVKYGPADRNVMDVWLAKSDKPTPVLFSIHGGGFRGGNKGVSTGLLQQCLDAGISVVAITYRLSDEAIAPAQMMDSARAVQFVRSQAKEWNLDKTRFASTGGSAGAGISLWLGFHDDLADPDNEDPVLRESTRLSCMVVSGGQTSYDPRVIRDLFPGTRTHEHPALAQLYDIDFAQLDKLPEEKYKLMELVSPINHLTKDDPPAMLVYGVTVDSPVGEQPGAGIHHAKFGAFLKEKMDPLGIECVVVTPDNRGELRGDAGTLAFVKKHFGMDK